MHKCFTDIKWIPENPFTLELFWEFVHRFCRMRYDHKTGHTSSLGKVRISLEIVSLLFRHRYAQHILETSSSQNGKWETYGCYMLGLIVSQHWLDKLDIWWLYYQFQIHRVCSHIFFIYPCSFKDSALPCNNSYIECDTCYLCM